MPFSIKQTFFMLLLVGSIANVHAQKMFDLQAHQGGAGLYPGNTIPAFLNALHMGVTTLELDAVITQDHHVVVSHDPYIHQYGLTAKKDTIGGQFLNYNIYSMSLDSVLTYDVGTVLNPEFPHRKLLETQIPLLAKLIDTIEQTAKLLGRPPIHYNIEIKSANLSFEEIYNPDYKTFCDLVLTVLKSKNILSRVMIQSFDPRALNYIHEKDATIQLSFLYSNHQSMAENLNRLTFTPHVLSPEYTWVTPEMVHYCQKTHLKLIPWTVDKPADIKRMVSLGVDGIITNYPDRVPVFLK